MGKKLRTLVKVGVVAVGAGAAGEIISDFRKKAMKIQKEESIEADLPSRDYAGNQVYLIGGGLGSIAGVIYLIRDYKFPGEQITIYEGMHIPGGSNDGIGTPGGDFVCRGDRMLSEETYENFWELLRTIPSLDQSGRNIIEETLNFDHVHPTCVKARLVDKSGKILDIKSVGFNQSDRMALLKLMTTNETKLDDMTIEQWFSGAPHSFETNFRYMWQATFAFQKWSSSLESHRYVNRMIFEFSRIETLEGITRTPLNQYDSVTRPLETYPHGQGVKSAENCIVTDIDFAEGDGITVQTLYLNDNGEERQIVLKSGDICIMTNTYMTDSATLGDMHTPAPAPEEKPISGELWAKIAAKKPNLGNPEPFFGSAHETNWESFIVTCKDDKLLKVIESFTRDVPGSGTLVIFKDSNRLMSSAVVAQPHLENQPMDETIFQGYGLYTDAIGDYVKKPMKDCVGEELLTEYLHHLHLDEEKIQELMAMVVNVTLCYMSYVDTQFRPRKMTDRPEAIPQGLTNFAMISQPVEIPEDMVSTEEYSVRAVRPAAYGLMGVDREVCPVTSYAKDPKVLMKAVQTTCRQRSLAMRVME